MNLRRRSFIAATMAGVPAAGTLLLGRPKSYSAEALVDRARSGKGFDGVTRADIPTPCLVLDLQPFEANIQKMSRHARSSSIALRPHAKTHKCVEIARRQIGAGALGVCVATIAEAEVMAQAGVKGLVITSEMVGRPKIRRLLRVIEKQPDTLVVVDHADNVQELQDAAAAARIRIPVLLDIDVGSNRTGLAPGEPALRLAEKAAACKNLSLKGLSAYAGHSSHVVGFGARKASSREAMAKALETRDLLRKNGHAVEILSGGSTGTYNIDSSIEGVSELQVGSYVFMDVDYRRIGGQSGPLYDDFAASLSVIATVIHRSGRKAIVDAGLKAFATDRKFGPELRDLTGVTYSFAGDEHGSLLLENPSREVKLGDRIEFIVPHCDPNVNLYDRIYVMRDEKVAAIWPIMDRGPRISHY